MIFRQLELWKKELRRGLIEFAILILLSKEEMYGYKISKVLQSFSKGTLSVEEGTLYPLLRRLEQRELIAGEWKIHQGRPRKYYKITEKGKLVLKEMMKFWEEITTAINKLIEVREI